MISRRPRPGGARGSPVRGGRSKAIGSWRRPNRSPPTDSEPIPSPADGAEWIRLAQGDDRRFHPLYVVAHEQGLLLTFGRQFGERHWDRTKDVVKESGARFARSVNGWTLPVEGFALDRVPGLSVLADPAARDAIEARRAELLSRFQALPAAARHFRPSVRELTPDEIAAHPALSEHERTFVLDVRGARPADLSKRQRDWLKSIEDRHRARLDEDPSWVQALFAPRALALPTSLLSHVAKPEPASTGEPSTAEKTGAPSAAEKTEAKRARRGRAPIASAKEAPACVPISSAEGATSPTATSPSSPEPTAPQGADGSASGAAAAEATADTPVLEAELALFRPRIEDLDREDLRRFPIFRTEDRAEVRRILAGHGSAWTHELQARLDGFLDAHPEVHRALFAAHAARRVTERERDAERAALERSKDDDGFELPRGFQRENLATGDLHPYQRKGVRWLLAARRGILAHDVGLGKTVQAIAAAAHLMDLGAARRALVVVPKARLVGWQREIQRFTDRTVQVIHGDRDERLRGYRLGRRTAFVIVGYHALQREVPELESLGADVLIVDEAHRLKGSRTLASQGFKALAEAPFVFFLTATPMPNRPEELHALLSHLHPKLLGTLWGEFVPRYAITETLRLRGRRRPVIHIKGYRNLDELKSRISPYVFLKTANDADVSLDLPPLREMVIELGLAAEQRELYRRMKSDAAKTLAEIDPRRFGPRERASLLTHILRLEQVTISPLLVDPAYRGSSPKLEEAAELVIERIERDAPGTIVFCRFLEALRAVRRILEQRGVDPGHIASIEGSVPAARIDEIEQGFRSGRFRVLLASDAAREGLNLQGSADLLLHLDVPWVPNVVHQRNGRIHRQGQSRPVTIMHFRIPGTIEERKVATLERKSGWIEEVLGAGGTQVETALSLDDLRAMLAEPEVDEGETP